MGEWVGEWVAVGGLVGGQAGAAKDGPCARQAAQPALLGWLHLAEGAIPGVQSTCSKPPIAHQAANSEEWATKSRSTSASATLYSIT